MKFIGESLPVRADHNERITRIGPQTPCGRLMRKYWQPIALLDEFDPRLDPRMATRPLKAVRVLGQDFVLFRDEKGQYGLVDRDCPHRGADLAFARHEGDGIRCPFHGWKFDTAGRCLETPAEPAGSKLCERVRQRSYPLHIRSGLIFAWLGPEDETPPAFPALDCFLAPDSHTFAFKGMWACNWLQAFEVGIDPSHTSFLHRFFQDESLEGTYGRQFRGASAGDVSGERWPMTRIMREFVQPDIQPEATPYGMRLTTLRKMSQELTHVRITHALFPHINVHDQWACESMGPVADRTRENLGLSDKAIMLNRRILMKAIDDVEAGLEPVGFAKSEVAQTRIGPDTVDGIAPAEDWENWWKQAVQSKRQSAPWS